MKRGFSRFEPIVTKGNIFRQLSGTYYSGLSREVNFGFFYRVLMPTHQLSRSACAEPMSAIYRGRPANYAAQNMIGLKNASCAETMSRRFGRSVHDCAQSYFARFHSP